MNYGNIIDLTLPVFNEEDKLGKVDFIFYFILNKHALPIIAINIHISWKSCITHEELVRSIIETNLYWFYSAISRSSSLVITSVKPIA